MRVVGERRFEHSRERVWAALMDPEVLARTLPGCRKLERDGDDAFTGRLQVSVGPVRGDFRGRLEMSELEPPDSYRMRLDGRGPSGFLSGEGSVRLEEVGGDGGGDATIIHYDLDAQVGGRLAGLGQRLLESSGKAVAAQGLDGLEKQLDAAVAVAGTADADVETPAEGTAGAAGEAPAAGSAASDASGGSSRAAADGPDAGGRDPAAAARTTAATGGAAAPRGAPPAPPSQGAFALGVAREVARDLADDWVPREARPFVVSGVCFVAGLLLGFWMGGKRR